MFSLRDIVSIAIKIEENGQRTYRRAARAAESTQVATLLDRLADEEAKHARWFAALGARVDDVTVDPQVAEMGQRILRGIVGGETFSLGDVDLEAIDTVEEVIDVAAELEEDTVLFYEMISGFVVDEATATHLRAIIEEERKHSRLLHELLGPRSSR